ILGLDDCAETPPAGTPDEPTFEICALNLFTVIVSRASDVSNRLTRVLHSSSAGQDECTDIHGIASSSPNYMRANGITEATDFRYYTNCTFSGEGDISTVVQVTMSPATDCYCTPVYGSGCEYGERISNVTLIGENTDINNSSECGEDAYQNF